MRIRKPDPGWELRDRRCPHCGEGELLFVICPDCGHLALACGELPWPVFPNPRDLTEQAEGTDPCPTCGKHAIDDYRLAEAQEILARGFAGSELVNSEGEQPNG